MTDYHSVYNISSKGFIPERCLENSPRDFKYLDYFLKLHQQSF